MDNPQERYKHESTKPAFDSNSYQQSGDLRKHDSREQLPAGFPSADHLLDPKRMKAADENSSIVRNLFPNEPKPTATPEGFAKDIMSPKSAAYRYLMDKEGFDKYDSAYRNLDFISKENDIARINQFDPTMIAKLDEIAAQQAKKAN